MCDSLLHVTGAGPQSSFSSGLSSVTPPSIVVSNFSRSHGNPHLEIDASSIIPSTHPFTRSSTGAWASCASAAASISAWSAVFSLKGAVHSTA
jgi:hypothetical protein